MVGSLGGRAPLFADSDEAFLGSAAFNFPQEIEARKGASLAVQWSRSPTSNARGLEFNP